MHIILKSDAYKYAHAPQYPDDTEKVYAYLEPRVGAKHEEIVFFGLQYLLKQLETPITDADVKEAKRYVDNTMGPGIFNEAGWRYILEVHKGKLPVEIWSLPEGTVVSPGTPMMAIQNTDSNCWWLTNFLETFLSHVWYGCTVATVSRSVRKRMLYHLKNTGCWSPREVVEFMLHDFGCRGVSSMESAAVGGAAHLVNFSGTDTMPGLWHINEFYEVDGWPGFSVPASEHSTMTSWGKEGEVFAYANMLNIYADKSIVSIVADSWDLQNAVERLFGDALKKRIIEKGEAGGRTVVRPDSGDPIETNLMVIRELVKAFGSETNQEGFLVLPPFIRILQGDGMTEDTIDEFLEAMAEAGYAVENWVLGMGGGLLQRINRDTERFAFKCSQITINGEKRDVFKRPTTDPSKNSKRGEQHEGMDRVFLDGKVLSKPKWTEVRNRATA